MIYNVLSSVQYLLQNIEGKSLISSSTVDTIHVILHEQEQNKNSNDSFWLYFAFTAAAIYILLIIYYQIKLYKSKRKISIAPITIEGNVPIKINTNRLVELFYIEFSKISKILSSSYRETQVSLYLPQSQSDTEIIMKASESINQSEDIGEIQLQSSMNLKLWGFDVPFNFIMEIFKYVLKKLPFVAWNAYQKNLIRVVFTTLNNTTSLAVFRYCDVINVKRAGNNSAITKLKETVTLEDFLDLISDAAYMVLQVAGKTIDNCSWKSMQSYIKGREYLQIFNTQSALGNEENSKEALKATFSNLEDAIESECPNYQATYFLACAILMERHKDTIDEAIRLFKKSYESDNKRLQLMSLCGVAFCYVQKVHRFATPYNKIKDELNGFIKKIKTINEEEEKDIKKVKGKKKRFETKKKWEDCQVMFKHILATKLIVATDKNKINNQLYIKVFMKLANVYTKLLESTKKNAYFNNVKGYLYMNILEIPNLTDEMLMYDKTVESLSIETEKILQHSIEIQPLSKLPHANLCLLYSTDWFRNKDANKYKELCIEEANIAVQIDPKYINGYKDLTTALIRYEDFKLAKKSIQKALDLAKGDKDKKEELVTFMMNTINDYIDLDKNKDAINFNNWLEKEKKSLCKDEKINSI